MAHLNPWGPPDSERSRGTLAVGEGEREEQGEGSKDILSTHADRTLSYRAGVACYMCKIGKYDVKISFIR